MPSPWRNQIKQDIKKQIFEKEQKTLTETDIVVNRHMARFLTDMKEAGCPKIWREAMKSEFIYLRSDLNDPDRESFGNK